MLGWSNERKIDAMISRATALAARITAAGKDLAQREAEVKAAIGQGEVLASLDATTEFADIDFQSVVNEIADLRAEHHRLTTASAKLVLLDAELTAVGEHITRADKQLTAADRELGGVETNISTAETTQEVTRAVLAEPGAEPAARVSPPSRGCSPKPGRSRRVPLTNATGRSPWPWTSSWRWPTGGASGARS